MDKQTFSAQCDYFNMVHGVTLRAIEALSDAGLDFRPAPVMRTARDLVFHVYSQEKLLAEAARQGKFATEAASRSSPEDAGNAGALRALVTVRDLARFAEACHRDALNIFSAMSEDELNGPVESPFGTYPAWRYFGFAYDEHWHHRGQLYM